MHGTRTIRCACCGLDQNASAGPGDRDGNDPMSSCARCAGHSGDSLEVYARREADHVTMYKHALVDAQDDTVLARSERDHYRDKMKTAYGSRELLVQVLSKIDDEHHYRGKRCVCGARGCQVVQLLAEPRVARLIRTYDEQRRTLRELRNANPEAWTDKWDFIDVTLVYPEREHRSGPGRHRAAG